MGSNDQDSPHLCLNIYLLMGFFRSLHLLKTKYPRQCEGRMKDNKHGVQMKGSFIAEPLSGHIWASKSNPVAVGVLEHVNQRL